MSETQKGISGIGVDQDDLFYPLNGFKRSGIDFRIKDSYQVETRTLAPIENSPYEFSFEVPENAFLDQSETFLEGQFRVLKEDNSVIGADDKISICNLSASALFELIEFKLNDTSINSISSKLYPYKAHVSTELSYSKHVKEHNLTPYLYNYEKLLVDGKIPIDHESDDDLKTRNGWISGSKKINFKTKFFLDIFHAEKHIPPSSKIHLNLIRNKDSFLLIKPATNQTNYKIQVTKLNLILKIIVPHDKYISRFRELIAKNDYVIPTNNTIIKNFVARAGNSTILFTNLNNEKFLPRQVLVCVVNRKSFNGDYNFNPFMYRSLFLKRMEMRLSNGKVLKLGRENDDLKFISNSEVFGGLEAYTKLLDATGFNSNTTSLGISYEKFKYQSFFGAFNITDYDLCNGFHKHPPIPGNFDIYMEFERDLTQDKEILIFGIFPAAISIDNKNKTLFYNFPDPPGRIQREKNQ